MGSRNPSTSWTLGSRRVWPDCPHPHPPHWHLGMAHGAFRSRVGLLVRLPPHLRMLPLQLTHLRLPPRLLLRHWGQTTSTTTTPTAVDIPSIDTTVVPTATDIQGPITRCRAK